MNETFNPKLILQDLFNALKSSGELNKYMDTDINDDYYIAIDGDLYSYNICIEITERPYVSYHRSAIYYPVDLASPEETEISGNFNFYITNIECFSKDGDEYDLSSILTPEILEKIKQNMDFDTDALVEDDDDLYESKIKLTEQDIKGLVKKIINEVSSKRTIINRIYKVTHDITGHLYHDENWHGVTLVVDAIESLGYDCEVTVKDGGYRSNPKDPFGLPWKEYLLRIETPEGFEVNGTLNCHSAGTTEDPFDRYDMSLVMW